MKLNAKLLNVLLTLLFISLFSGCSTKCTPTTITIVEKPSRPVIPEANITQCSTLKKGSILDKQKCLITNYLNTQKELQQYKEVLFQITKP